MEGTHRTCSFRVPSEPNSRCVRFFLLLLLFLSFLTSPCRFLLLLTSNFILRFPPWNLDLGRLSIMVSVSRDAASASLVLMMSARAF